MQCFKRGSKAEPFNSLTWTPAWGLQASCVPVRALDWLCPRWEVDVCSSIPLYVCRWFVVLTQSSLQSRRNEWDCTLASIRARPLVVAVCMSSFIFSPSLKCLTGPQPSWLTWINEPCYLREDKAAEWFRRMKMARWICRLMGGGCFQSVRGPPWFLLS